MRVAGLPLLVLVAGLAVTTVGMRTSQQSLRAREQQAATREADLLESELRRRVSRAVDGLADLRATHAAAGSLTSGQLRQYMRHRDLAAEFPGVRGFGVLERVPRGQVARFEARQRAEGHPAFRVRTNRADGDLFVVRSIEPESPNSGALGFDSGSTPQALVALDHAIDDGRMALTAPLRLQQDDQAGIGWVLYAPVYHGEPRSTGHGHDALAAVVFAPFTARDLLGSLAEQAGVLADFRVYDEDAGVRRLVHDAGPAQAPAAGASLWRRVLLGDRLLLLEVIPQFERLPVTGRDNTLVILVVGGLLSFGLAWLTWMLAAGRLHALAVLAARDRDVRRLAGIVVRTSGAVFTTDTNGLLTWVNPAFETVTGLQASDLLGRDVLGVLRIAEIVDIDARRQLKRDLLAGQGRSIELASARGDGTPLVLEVAVEADRDTAGRITGYSGIALDITRRKLAEDQLAAREHMLRTITDNMPARISYWDEHARCLFANRRYGEIWGRRDGSGTLGVPMQDIVPPQRCAEVQPHVRQVLLGIPQQFEDVLRLDDGRETTWQVHMIPDVLEGRVRGFFVLSNEVTELKTARDEALAASRAKTRFLSSMSHEIRTPMNAILGMLMLLRGTQLSERQEDYAGKAEGAARSLLSLLNDVLDFSKIEAGKMQLDHRPFSLDRLLSDLSVILSSNVGSRDIELLYDLDPAVPDALVGDDMRLRQILINLGGNAIKFTEHGEVVVSTRLLARTAAEATIEIAVSDTGIGIGAREQEALFQDYVQASADTARHFGGTGLGLGICRRLAELMGSQLRVQSAPGEGSRFSFTVTLPLAEGQVPPPAPPVDGIGRVLVVDDNALARASVVALAGSIGWEVDSAEDGATAVERVLRAEAAGRPYDAVFLDWRMPGIDGWDACLRIRAEASGASMPLVVMVTAQGRETLAHRTASEQALIDAFLVKPVTAAMLRDSVDRVLHAPPRAPSGAPHPTPLAGLRLMVAEDNPVNQQIARELLEGQGAAVEIACDGRDAVDRLAAGERYDCVLMDVLMPTMDGLVATRHIRAMPGLAALPIIAMTANAMESDRAECLAAGMNDHVGKPVVLAEVVGAILRHVAAAGATPGHSAPLPAPRPEVPLLDRAGAVARMGGNAALFDRLLAVFAGNLRQSAADLQAARDRAAHDEMVRLVHTIKGMAATMGAAHLADTAQRAERALRTGGDGDALAGEVSGAIDSTLLALDTASGA